MYAEAKRATYGTLEAQMFQKSYKKWDIREMNMTGVS